MEDTYASTADYYDFVPAYENRQDVAFYAEMARACGGPVLEIGCGSGRVLIPTARTGVACCGLDLSAWMLDRFRSKLAAEPAEVQARVALFQGDMRSFNLERSFKLITMPFRPFQHLETTADQLACLECVHAHLAPDGRFVLDVFNPSIKSLADDSRMVAFGHEPEATLPDGRKFKRWARFKERNLAEQVNHVELIYDVTHPDGRTEQVVDSFPMRYLFRFEAEHLLARAGFEVEALYADYDKSPFGSKYPGELIFVVRKKA